MPSSVNDTARSLLAFFGTMAEWGERGTLGQHGASPELMALAVAILDIVPAAWHPHKGRDEGWVTIYQPQAEQWRANLGSYDRGIAVHGVSRPPRYVEPDGATADHATIDKAAVAALVGLASVRTPKPAPLTVTNRATMVGGLNGHELGTVTTRFADGRVTHTWSPDEPGCARVMATLTDADIAAAEMAECPVCKQPAHAGETDDLDRHPECQGGESITESLIGAEQDSGDEQSGGEA